MRRDRAFTVQRAELVGTLPSWAHGDPKGVAFNYGTPGEQHFAVIRDIAPGTLPAVVTDTKPAVNAALDKVQAAITGARPA